MAAPFLLDTGGVIDYDAIELGEWALGTALVAAVTVGELAYGADVGDAAERERRRARLRAVIRDYEVLPYGVEEAKFYGALATVVRSAGRDPRPRRLDLQIAATAAVARLPLLTTNPDDFRGVESLVDVVPVARGR